MGDRKESLRRLCKNASVPSSISKSSVSGSNSPWSLLNLQGISGVQISIMYAFYQPWCLDDFEESLEQLLHFKG